MSIGAWLRAARPLAHANIAPPIVLGQALAAAVGAEVRAEHVALGLGFGVLDHLTIVFVNDYADRDADALHDAPTLVSGGSRVIQRGLLTPAALRRAAIASALALLVYCGLGAAWLERPLLPVFALSALAILAAYSLPPLRMSYQGFGEILQGVGVGAVLPVVGFYAIVGDLEPFPFEVLAPLIVFGFASNILTALPDVEGDRKADKQTWPVRRGAARARRDALSFIGVALLLSSQVGPPLSANWRAISLVPPAVAVVLALRYLKRAEAGTPECLRFVLLGAGSIGLLHVGWATALFLSA